jgi:transglutaminase-like putative cysteine protease
MEVRMQPRSDSQQRCVTFRLQTQPRARVLSYTDYLGNNIHHFNVPGHHSMLAITAEALVEVLPSIPLPESLGPDGWHAIAAQLDDHDSWDMTQPSQFARPSDALRTLAYELGANRQHDPIATLRQLNTAIFRAFAYAPQSTRVDSPIEDAIGARRGVCQDFAHIMIAMVRDLGIPCRYVSGYLFHRSGEHDRSEADATHAWIEALLPGLGWVGFDPTNNLIVGDRHVRTAVGRDYADVPPTRGTFKGGSTSELQVSVRVAPASAPSNQQPASLPPAPIEPDSNTWSNIPKEQQQQQQQ